MFTEVIKLIPQMDSAALNSMFTNLNKRFAGVAKAFGKGMGAALKFGPIFALVSTLVSKLLNPLEKAEEIIDKILGKSGDLQDSAEELETTPGRLARLEALGQMKGLDPAVMRTLLTKFQTDLSQEKENERLGLKPGLLRNFTGESDTAEAFFQFIQSLQTLPPEQKVLAQTQVFGERIRGRASAFFNDQDYQGKLDTLPSESVINRAVTRADNMGDRLDELDTVRALKAFVNKATTGIQPVMITDIVQGRSIQDKAESETLARYENNKKMYLEIQKIIGKADAFFTKIVDEVAPSVIDGLKRLGDVMDKVIPLLERLGTWGQQKVDEIRTFGGGRWDELFQLIKSGKWMPTRVDKK